MYSIDSIPYRAARAARNTDSYRTSTTDQKGEFRAF